jgi:hypothetical protein
MSTTPSGNHESLKSKIPKRKKARSNYQLSCKIEYYIKTSFACFLARSAFFTDDSVMSGKATAFGIAHLLTAHAFTGIDHQHIIGAGSQKVALIFFGPEPAPNVFLGDHQRHAVMDRRQCRICRHRHDSKGAFLRAGAGIFPILPTAGNGHRLAIRAANGVAFPLAVFLLETVGRQRAAALAISLAKHRHIGKRFGARMHRLNTRPRRRIMRDQSPHKFARCGVARLRVAPHHKIPRGPAP